MWPNICLSFHSLYGKDGNDIPVLIADHFISPFQVLTPGDVKVKYFPREFVPPGALHSISETLKEDGQGIYSTIVGIPEGQPLTRTILNETGKEHGMSSLLRPGKVAVSFKVERDKSAGGWVHPGDTIAIFQKIRSEFSGRAEQRQTRLLLNAVEVLAVNQAHLGRDSSEEPKADGPLQAPFEENAAQVLTVLTNTADASALVDAQEAGPLTIVLRPLGDNIPWLQSKSDMLP
jgi:pilus assembly protein CpaB